jgi:tetratricopeptide (TPR) repeat protein
MNLSTRISLPIILALFFALAEPASAKSIYKDFNSFADYQVAKNTFKLGIQTTAGEVGTLWNSPNANKAKLQQVIAKIRGELNTEPRGYHDQLWFLLGLAQEKLGDNKSAISSYKNAYKLRGYNVLPLFRQAFLERKQNNTKKASTLFSELLWRTDKYRYEIFFQLAECDLAENNKEGAYRYLQRANVLNPNYVPALKELNKIKMDALPTMADPILKQTTKQTVVSNLNKIASQEPNDRESALALAKILLQESDPLLHQDKIARAESYIKNIVKKSDYKDEEAVKLLFDAQIKMRDLVAAENTANLGLAKLPNSAVLKEAKQQLEVERGIKDLPQ